MRDCEVRHAVLGQLVDQRAHEDELEELVQLLDQPGLRRLLPGVAPKEEEDLCRGEQGSTAVGQPRLRDRRQSLGSQGHDPDGLDSHPHDLLYGTWRAVLALRELIA